MWLESASELPPSLQAVFKIDFTLDSGTATGAAAFATSTTTGATTTTFEEDKDDMDNTLLLPLLIAVAKQCNILNFTLSDDTLDVCEAELRSLNATRAMTVMQINHLKSEAVALCRELSLCSRAVLEEVYVVHDVTDGDFNDTTSAGGAGAGVESEVKSADLVELNQQHPYASQRAGKAYRSAIELTLSSLPSASEVSTSSITSATTSATTSTFGPAPPGSQWLLTAMQRLKMSLESVRANRSAAANAVEQVSERDMSST
jgi:hypothetical protein